VTDSEVADFVYTDELIDKFECRWGEGFMSPGGAPELAELLRPVKIQSRRVLDFGCGTGGFTSLLVSAHGAGEVVGVDIEPRVLARAERLAVRQGLADRISYHCVSPGPLDFATATFDFVLSIGAIVHHSNQPQLFRDFHRLLRPGGQLVISDWYATEDPFTEEMRRWTSEGEHTFEMASLKQTAGLAREVGFVAIEIRDRNDWFRAETRRDLERLKRSLWDSYVARFGLEAARFARQCSETFVQLADQGQLRPGYLYARKPQEEF
jgi:SAM-dependent methyltransferase